MKKGKHKFQLHPHGSTLAILVGVVVLGATLFSWIGPSYGARKPTALAPDQVQETSDEAFSFGQIDPFVDIAQSFQVTETIDLNQVSLFLGKVGDPQTAAVRIVEDNDGVPGTTPIGSGVIIPSSVSATPGWINISINEHPLVTAGQTYWFVVDTRYPETNDYYTTGSLTTNAYPSGLGMYSKNWKTENWGDAVRDFTFRIWLAQSISGNGDPSPVPSGSTKWNSYIFKFSNGDLKYGTAAWPNWNNVDMTVGGYDMTVHTSCSDLFENGYGSAGDPTQSEGHPSVVGFRIWKYVNNDFKTDCFGGEDVLDDIDCDEDDDDCGCDDDDDDDDDDDENCNGGGGGSGNETE